MNAAQALLERIHRDGAIDGEVIKVDRFLNHMVDPQLIELMAADIAARFAGRGITKVLTVETSGIMLAMAVAAQLGTPFIYAKKKRPITMREAYSAQSYSFTKQETTTLYVSREVLPPEDRILFIDDFYSKGSTLKAIEEIIAAAGATLVGTAVIINKSERNDIESILTLKDLTSA
ncbi:MAG: xanthine phosphoribosyltransferase [Desulfuromonas sp.]|nr:MAG: xanthine phosphoribosyltransferase [Desulfuromonas sp.]